MQTETYYAPLINYPTNDNSIDIFFAEFDKDVDEIEDENGNFVKDAAGNLKRNFEIFRKEILKIA